MTTPPDFLVIGAQKAGTTTLYQILRQHPDIYMCDPKEPHFFSKDEVYSRGWHWYQSLFEQHNGAVAIGEASTTYSRTCLYSEVPARIHAHIPHAKLIYMVRHPMRRIESAFKHISNAWRSAPDMPSGFHRAVKEYPALLEWSMYWATLSSYLQYFNDDQILVVFFEELESDPGALLGKCHEFLGVSSQLETAVAHQRWNVSDRKQMIRPWARRLVRSRAYPMARLAVPPIVRTMFRRRFAMGAMPATCWDENTKMWVIDRLKDDTQAFLSYMNKPPNYWILN